MRAWGTLIVGALLAALVVTLVLRNGQEVSVDLLLTTWPTKLWGALVAAAIVGAGSTATFLFWPMARLNLRARRHQKRIAELEQEVHGLRTLPIASDAASSSSAQKV